MKCSMLIFALVFAAITTQAQLAKTNWKGKIKGDAAQETILKFGKDTVVLYAMDGSVIETMKFTVKQNVVTLTKLSGQSDCTTATTGKYKMVVTGSNMAITAVADGCGDRSVALNSTAWVKQPGKPKP